jgi:hypothetical protein
MALKQKSLLTNRKVLLNNEYGIAIKNPRSGNRGFLFEAIYLTVYVLQSPDNTTSEVKESINWK